MLEYALRMERCLISELSSITRRDEAYLDPSSYPNPLPILLLGPSSRLYNQMLPRRLKKKTHIAKRKKVVVAALQGVKVCTIGVQLMLLFYG